MNRTGKIITAFAAGAAAGALLGILFAPAKGSDTRKKIRNMKEDMEDKLSRAQQKVKDMKNDLEETLREKAEKFS